MTDATTEAREGELRGNLWRLCGIAGLQMTLFPVAVITLFHRDQIGMDMTDIMVLQALFGLSMAIFEFPSGYVADRLGYRRTMIAAAVVGLVGWVAYARAVSFSGVLFAEMLLGVGMSLVSGSDGALLYESLVGLGQEREYARWHGRVRFCSQTAEGTAALLAGVLYVADPRLPLFLQVPVWIAAIVLTWGLVEPARERPPAGDHLGQATRIVRTVLVEHPELRRLVPVMVVFSLSSFIPVWIVPLHAREAGVAAEWIGPLWAVANYSVALGALGSHRLVAWQGVPRLVGLGICLVAIGYGGLGLTHAWWGFAFYFLLTTVRGALFPALLHEEQRRVPSSDRAGFLSFRSLLFRLGFLVVGPLVGVGLDVLGAHVVLQLVGTLLVVVLVPTSLAFLRTGGGSRPVSSARLS